jgi:hypothetical protein
MFFRLDHEPHCTPTQDVLLLQRCHPMGRRAHTCQAFIFKVVDLVGHDGYDWELSRCGFFRPGTIELREPANEGWEARFMVLTIKPGLVPSITFHLLALEADPRSCYEAVFGGLSHQ